MTLSGPIAYLTGEYPRATDTFIQREVAALRAQGVTVLTCSIRKTGPEHLVGDEQKAEAATTFYVLKAARNIGHLLGCHLRAMARGPGRYFSALGLAFRTRASGAKALLYQLFYFLEAVVLADHMRRNNVCHLHNHIAKASCTVAMLASRVSGIPFSFTLHGPDIFFEPMRWRLDRKISEAKFVACISHFCRSQAMAFSDERDWTKLHIVHCGIDPLRYQGKTTARSGNQLLFVGRLAGVKGVPLLLGALPELAGDFPDLRLVLIGDGPDRAELEHRAERLGISEMVTFAGYKSQTEVAKALMESDALVLPSFAEGVPVVLMEAMAAGLPVISTRIAGIPELVEDGVSGLLTPPGDGLSLSSALRQILTDANLRNDMGLAGHAKVVREFDIGKESEWLLEILSAYNNSSERPGLRPVVRQ